MALHSSLIDKPRTSLVSRYSLLTVLILLGGLISLGALYERFANDLETALVGERLTSQETATASRLAAFMETYQYQLAKISNYPGLTAYLANPTGPGAREVANLLHLEADVPDLYGILFFDRDGHLQHVVPGQAASGPPYWSAEDWSISDLPRVRLGDATLIGPHLPSPGRSGWVLLQRPIRDAGQGSDDPVTVALHLRLSSITEQLDEAMVTPVVKLRLQAADGAILDVTGRPLHTTIPLGDGPEVFPGWSLKREVRSEVLFGSLEKARGWLYAGGAAITLIIVLLFGHLTGRLRRRVDDLIAGADALAAGDLEFRLRGGERSDEIGSISRAFNTMTLRLRDMIDRTVRTEKMAVLGQFATGVAHEVRNPLATLKTTVQALSRDEADPDRKELLQDMESEVDRLNRVVNDLLTYGRPHPAEQRQIPVRELFRRTATLLRPTAAERGVSFVTSGESTLTLLADGDQLQQVLVNLGLNAIQACQTGDSVTLRASRQGPDVIIEVSDSGCGIDPALLATVTDPFVTTKAGGTGLGLTISAQMIDANHGTMRIDSRPGEGTRVRLRLPGEKTKKGAWGRDDA
ncbi:sensor histidine kinase [Insolitispirillum peregrinum]|uniref:histidine kinase n=1 Tax=Insolitispirillum peregrinum TaxID=80876 RepID=A0A1N7L0Q6_9PROT|nr:ATP-binding protein [Insolitispirillum peregrinum]SIS67442.1 two-component system, NtrC family, sensor histidine kinase AtoS [Insolitispirillum peregrinum]